MPPPYNRTIDTASGRVYIDPLTGKPTEIIPSGGLSPSNQWIPIKVAEDGTVFVESGGMVGTPHFDDSIQDVDPGVDQVLIDHIVPANTIRNVSQVLVVTRVTGIFTVVANDEIIGSGRTGPGGTGPMIFNPPRPISSGVEYQVIFTSRLNAPVQSVECYLQASDIST